MRSFVRSLATMAVVTSFVVMQRPFLICLSEYWRKDASLAILLTIKQKAYSPAKAVLPISSVRQIATVQPRNIKRSIGPLQPVHT